VNWLEVNGIVMENFVNSNVPDEFVQMIMIFRFWKLLHNPLALCFLHKQNTTEKPLFQIKGNYLLYLNILNSTIFDSLHEIPNFNIGITL